MMNRDTFAALAVGAAIFTATAIQAQAPPVPTPNASASDAAGVLPALPALPGDSAVPAAAPADTTAPLPAASSATMPALPAASSATMPALPGTLPALPGPGVAGAAPPLPGIPSYGGVATLPAVPTPPPLGNISAEASDSESASVNASSPTSAAPSQLYTFLFIDDPENGVVRQKFNTDTAKILKETEITRLMENRRQQSNTQGIGAGAGITGFNTGFDPALGGDPALLSADPALAGPVGSVGSGAPGAGGSINTNNLEAVRAAAEWDFYYNQLEMYDHYVREKLIPESKDLTSLAYDASNALQERQDLFESFQDGAITRGNEDFNGNREFYERLQKREDRRIAYRQWLMHKQNEVAEWFDVWARQINGTRWADGEEVRVDDWYYGTDFNSAKPVLVTMDNREYIVSREPVNRLQQGQLNVISSNLTPYDIIDGNGYLKNPALETLRGTLVIPTEGPAYSPGTKAGTIEIVPGTVSE